MAEPTVEELEAALARHASGDGEVFPSALKLIAAEHHWSGRLWEVLGQLATDVETLRYAAGGDRPGEIAQCAARWADSALDIEDIALILRCGGYDPDPFLTLSQAGLLHAALSNDDGTLRRVNGERAGTWISDELALASSEETIERVRLMIANIGPTAARRQS